MSEAAIVTAAATVEAARLGRPRISARRIGEKTAEVVADLAGGYRLIWLFDGEWLTFEGAVGPSGKWPPERVPTDPLMRRRFELAARRVKVVTSRLIPDVSHASACAMSEGQYVKVAGR